MTDKLEKEMISLNLLNGFTTKIRDSPIKYVYTLKNVLYFNRLRS